jgi:hypothetical protein
VRVTHAEGYHLVGLRFSRPISSNGVGPKASQRKVASSV